MNTEEAGDMSFTLGITSLDFGQPNVTLFQGLQRGLRRNSLRLKHFQQQYMRNQLKQGAKLDDHVSFEAPVSTALTGFVTTASIGTPPVSFTVHGHCGHRYYIKKSVKRNSCLGLASYILHFAEFNFVLRERVLLGIASDQTEPNMVIGWLIAGSDLVWRQCLPCEHCYEQDSATIFNPSHSSTYEQASCTDTICSALIPRSSCSSSSSSSSARADYIDDSNSSSSAVCSYSYSYGDQSFTVDDFSFDTLTLPDLSGRPRSVRHFAFGCGHNNDGGDPSFGGAGGLMGFGRGAVSLPSQLQAPKFSYCLKSITHAASKTSPLFIGSAALDQLQRSTAPDSRGVVSTPLISNPALPSFYFVKLKGISVGSKAIHVPAGTFDIGDDGSGGIIVDSGTTITYLPSPAYDAVVAALTATIHLPRLDSNQISVPGFDLCYSSRSQLQKQAALLTFHFRGSADMRLPFANYFVDASEELVCLALASNDVLQQDGLSIFGRQDSFVCVEAVSESASRASEQSAEAASASCLWGLLRKLSVMVIKASGVVLQGEVIKVKVVDVSAKLPEKVIFSGIDGVNVEEFLQHHLGFSRQSLSILPKDRGSAVSIVSAALQVVEEDVYRIDVNYVTDLHINSIVDAKNEECCEDGETLSFHGFQKESQVCTMADENDDIGPILRFTSDLKDEEQEAIVMKMMGEDDVDTMYNNISEEDDKKIQGS
ncbi:hypothetical protein L7F22_045364 [Adiantum nelumboides]|nr:hypothetical protein [Adiantum nelumboides]